MELRNLQTFLRAAELRSFSEAARQTGYSQSAVSAQIAQLERELGVPLFDRIGRTVSLTEQGRDFLEYAGRILRLTDAAARHLQKAPEVAGELRLAMAESLLLTAFPPVLAELRARYPQVRVVVRTGVTGEMVSLLERGQADLIYTLDRRIRQQALACELEQAEPVCFIAPVGHPLADGRPRRLQELLGEPFLLTERRMSYRDQLDQLLAARGLTLEPVLELGNTELLCRLVGQGMGLSFLPGFVARPAAARGEVARIPVEDCPVDIWRQLIRHRGKFVTPAMQALTNLLHERQEGGAPPPSF